MENLDSILKKLKKLQRLYEGAKAIGSENEAENAALAIQRILFQYNLTMEQVDSAAEREERRKEEIIEEDTSGFTRKSIGGRWEARLVYVLCKYNLCRSFTCGSGYMRIKIFGKRENIEIVKWLRDVLTESFVRLSVKRWNEFRESAEYLSSPMSKDRFQRAYLMGAVTGLEEKFEKEERKGNSEGVAALIVRNNAAIDLYVQNKYRVVQGHASGRVGSADAYAMGRDDGRNAQVARGGITRGSGGGAVVTRMLK